MYKSWGLPEHMWHHSILPLVLYIIYISSTTESLSQHHCTIYHIIHTIPQYNSHSVSDTTVPTVLLILNTSYHRLTHHDSLPIIHQIPQYPHQNTTSIIFQISKKHYLNTTHITHHHHAIHVIYIRHHSSHNAMCIYTGHHRLAHDNVSTLYIRYHSILTTMLF